MSNLCKNRIVIITGAGKGLGRAHALAFSAEGATVIVNDIDELSAQAVVDKIQASGGTARTNNFDITNYQACTEVIQDTVDTYGDLHVIVNNAGINRDRMFVSMTEDDWDTVMTVHLKGHFCLSSNAVRYWRTRSKAGYKVSGRIINTSSGAGLQGSVGQSNYAAAKAGIVALTLNQAAELARYKVTANAITPSARTSMTMAVPTMAERMKKPDNNSFDYWSAANVSPLLVWLGSEQSAHISGKIFESEGGKISIADGWRSTKGIDKGNRWQPTEIGSVIDKLLAKESPAQPVYGAE
ncbi:SDR family oxidoreductase [Microbulbifer sp. 2205BS26-8]|uniref:SDR family oxidoreductase n=1 Tax=Microbulbifer sp. 2205BS26-8 TaxID=3064386 RepID=UPI00273FE5A9|nr:SDR family oxidoreductase [Microbulbifer sp. 2205BS26-8]MDP5209272.1 SDR family oxidoreductase [Microbulbifer sp. 2205BS26-8]